LESIIFLQNITQQGGEFFLKKIWGQNSGFWYLVGLKLIYAMKMK
jgi:hypothetical protein